MSNPPCPECSAQKVTHRPHCLTFDYAGPSGRVELRADVQMFQCGGCGFSFLDHTAETAKDEAVKAYLAEQQRIVDLPYHPVVWVSAKQTFYDCSDAHFMEAFRALCRWSSPDPNGPAWVTPVLHEGWWHVSARQVLTEERNTVVKAISPEGATVALAVTLGLTQIRAVVSPEQ